MSAVKINKQRVWPTQGPPRTRCAMPGCDARCQDAMLGCMMAEKAHTDVSNNEAMRWTMQRCDARWGDAMHDEAMRCTMRRCDER